MEDNYALMFKALSDENRLKIFELLIDGETCGCTLIDKLTIKQPTLSYHLKTLADSGLTTIPNRIEVTAYFINADTGQSQLCSQASTFSF